MSRRNVSCMAQFRSTKGLRMDGIPGYEPETIYLVRRFSSHKPHYRVAKHVWDLVLFTCYWNIETWLQVETFLLFTLKGNILHLHHGQPVHKRSSLQKYIYYLKDVTNFVLAVGLRPQLVISITTIITTDCTWTVQRRLTKDLISLLLDLADY